MLNGLELGRLSDDCVSESLSHSTISFSHASLSLRLEDEESGPGQERWGVEEFHGIRPRWDRKGWVLIGVFNVDVHPRDGFAVVIDKLSTEVDQDLGLIV